MRCRMRCGDIRRCGGPIRKPTPPTPPGPSQFNVVNGIFVDVNMSGTGTRKNTRAVGDRFTAKVFMLNEDSPNYVLLEWTHGGATSMALMGLANDEHTQNMFADAIRNKLAREIETMYDNGEIENGFVKFTDDDWTEIQEYYATDLTPESAATLQAELMDDAIVREPEQNCFTSMFFGYNSTPVSEVSIGKNETYSASWWGLPDDQHIVDPVVYEIGDESIATITNYTAHPADEQWSAWYSGYILGVNMGQTTITFYSVNNPRGTKTVIPVTVTPPESYYYINLHEDTGEINVDVGNTYTCYAEVEDYRVGDTLAASGYDDSIISVSFQKRSQSHGGWWSDWEAYITGLQAGETTVRIHSVNNPEVYEDLFITVSEPIPPVPVESIGAPSVDAIDTQEYWNPEEVTFSYLPIDADDMSNIVFNSTNSEVARVIDAGARKTRYENGICTFYIKPGEAGTATVSYSLGGTTYNVYVHVTAPQIIPLQSISSPGSASIAVGGETTINYTLSPSNATVELGDFDVISMEEQSVGVTDVQLENGVLSVTVTGFALMCGAPINVDYLPSGGTIYASCYVDSYANVTVSSDGELFEYGEPCDNPSIVTICDNGASWSLTNGALNVNGEEFTGGADATTWTMDGVEINDGDSGEITGDVTFNIGAMLPPYTITIETEAKPEDAVINYGINETWTYEAPESDFPITLDFSEPISLSYQSDVVYCGALLDNGNYQFWGTYENNSVHIEMNGEPLSNGDEITIDSDTTLKFVRYPPVVQSIEDFSDAYVLCGETMNLYVDILPPDASYSTADFNLTFTDGSGNVVQNPPVTADVVSILNVEGHVVGIGIEVIGGQTAGDVYMTVEYTPSQGAISGGGWIHVGPAATALSDIEPLQIRVGELGSYRVGGLTPSDALTKGITVTSSDDSVVSVGLLYNDLGSLLVDLEGLSAGEATLTITLANGAEYENTVTVVDRWQTVVETMHGGIYHNAEDGIYYLTDAGGNSQIAISDTNLNATGLWDPNDWDDGGTYGTWGGNFQWGNNYDFNLEHTTSHEQVDASAYGPSNPYNVDVLITPENQGNYYFWDSSSNTNLWGYDDYDTSYQSGTPDVSVMKGPCPEGWHVPLREEWNQLLQLWSYIRTGSTTAPADTTLMSSDLLLPMYDDGWGLLRANFLNVGNTTTPVGFVWGSQMTGFYLLHEDTYNIRPFIDELPEDLPEWNASGDTCYAELQYVIDEISLETPYQINASIQYDGCENADPTNITTSSDDENVAVAEMQFDVNGASLIIRSVAPGTCTVTTTDGNNSFTTAVTVTAPTPPTYATISSGSENVTMAPGDSVAKRISFSPSDADTSNITWTNSDSNVANGSQQLLLEGMCDTAIDAYSEGTCAVTVSDGTNSYVYNVTVVEPEPEE